MPPSGGIPLQNRSRWSRKCPRVPRECSPSLEGSVGTRLEVLPDILQGDQPFSVILCSDGYARAHPSGVAPEASEEWFDSSTVLILFVMPRSALLFPHAAWP